MDAPAVPAIMAGTGLVALLGAVLLLAIVGTGPVWALVLIVWAFAVAVFMLASAASFLYTTLAGKFVAWSRILDGLGLRGEERVLDLGCGRGAVLLLAARRLRAGVGSAVGVDLWRTVDQSGNSPEATLANARVEGVADRVRLRTGDLTDLPFAAGEFDVVLSSLAIHNIPDAAGRQAAIDEAVRVLRPGGRLAVADFRHTADYERRLVELGATAVASRNLGWRFWYGGPWAATRLVTATLPAAAA